MYGTTVMTMTSKTSKLKIFILFIYPSIYLYISIYLFIITYLSINILKQCIQYSLTYLLSLSIHQFGPYTYL